MSPDNSDTVRLRRNRSGDVIHRDGCPHLRKTSIPWIWAEKNADEDWAKTAPWLSACKTCNPPSPLNSEADRA